MERTPDDRGSQSEFRFDPTNKVAGVVDNDGEAEAALLDFRNAGFAVDQVELLTNEEAARRIDVSSEGRQVTVHVFHSTQKMPAFYDAPVIVKRIEEELRASHHLIAVTANDAAERERVREILKVHGGHFINFYGRWAAESLEP
jgi:hypothetical protein